MEYKFHLNNLRIAPRKVRLVANLVKKSSVLSAEAQLKFQNKRAALPILKLLKSATASAINNFNLSSENLYIDNIFVDEGQKLKRFRPRAFGRAGAIHKKTSHITIVLKENTMLGAKKIRKKAIKYLIPATKIKTEKLSEIKDKKPALVSAKGVSALSGKSADVKGAPKEIKPQRKFSDFTRKIFRRKAIG